MITDKSKSRRCSKTLKIFRHQAFIMGKISRDMEEIREKWTARVLQSNQWPRELQELKVAQNT